ncbi:Choline-sulfatase [Pontiella desulfatans]|uniref:Choline-sulfatase n=1 Tax=Pontiella desulfatans TaxID=2750659 RepID=A0A6C2U0Y9_PONDE|nr:sulfatase-like hydrolase/transferase [Pontiella desulfatans]SPS73846.1 sulfatase S1_9 [Kiritimatiellales bacterium]VGO13602.1 Choline-sulfatase [Pontiella desulfatans]
MDRRKNIVFLHVDQLTANVLSAYGETGANRPATFTRTPGLDHIASRGRTFINSYCAGPQCVPSRSSWYTSRTVAETGVLRNQYVMGTEFPNLGSWLRDKADYLPVYAGKWHVSRIRVEDGFELLDKGSGHGEANDAGVGRSAMAFLNNYSGEKPFFLNVGLLNPHDCCFFSPTYGKYGLSDRGASGDLSIESPPLPKNFNGAESKWLKDWTEADWRYYLYQYSRQTEMIDTITKRIWDTLRASKFADNTLFIFSADHGEGAANKGRVSKGYLDDNTMRVPLICEGPGIANPGTVDRSHLVSGIDIGATVCEIAGCAPMPGVSVARSFLPLLAGEQEPWRDYVVCESGKGGFGASVISERYQCNFRHDGQWEVFDRINDPFQINNLAATDAGRQAKEKHLEYLRDYLGKITVCLNGGQVTPKYADTADASMANFQTMLKMYDAISRGEALYV